MVEDNILKGNIFCLANVDAEKVLNSLEDDENPSPEIIGRKRKRLDDFTPQEKMIRRKLKNRVAAQNARDRKKERLEQLEHIVDRLEKENKELKKSNDELRTNMTFLMSQNKTMRLKLGMSDGDFEQPKTLNITQSPIITPTVGDHDHIVIKKEEETDTEYASLGRISLQQKLQVLLVSLVTMWLANPRLANCLTSLNESEQEVVVKYLLQKKLILQKSNVSNKKVQLIQLLLQMNLIPIIQNCLPKTPLNYFPSAKKSKTLWMDPAIL
ncbi:uncharacterized protein [Clytia hemisphaerica]|uniref:X-box-binding protein 1 n=1 Tax=Clytia hemisphaerica TaxID=252671 RepID=A0A7M5WYZ3_9CNID|eukprot:TCONS_00011468-protein